jgi:hypothetical protein
MILNVEELKNICSVILTALDSTEFSSVSETLQLNVEDNRFVLSVTNREYFVKAFLDNVEESDFFATVDATLFLKLISNTTTETVQLKLDEQKSSLIVIGDGHYKLPLIFDNEELLKLPEIEVDNITTEFDIDSAILRSISTYNTKQLSVGVISRPVQKMFYVDEQGAVTFTSGACVNTFTLPSQVKLLLNQRLVKLFKLFKAGNVHFSLGHETVGDDLIQDRVKFNNSNIEIRAILFVDPGMIESVPVSAIRGIANADYTHSVVIERAYLQDTLNRIGLFAKVSGGVNATAKFSFTKDSLTVSDIKGINKETLFYNNEITNIDEGYDVYLDLNEVVAVLDTCTEKYINIKFGDGKAVTINRGNIINILPEIVLTENE